MGAPGSMSGSTCEKNRMLDLINSRFKLDKSTRHLGITLLEAEPGRVVMTMPVQDWMFNGHGVLHGGYLFLLGDTVFAFVCESLASPSLTRQADITFIAPGREISRITATGIERRRYGRNSICDVVVEDENGTLLAELRVHGVLSRIET